MKKPKFICKHDNPDDGSCEECGREKGLFWSPDPIIRYISFAGLIYFSK